jgi:ferric-dicitrate binding protein FerR (iron transport regulator)
MSMSRTRSAGQTGAKGILSGTVSNGASWIESFRVDVDGAEIAGAGTSAWQLNLRDESGSVVLSVSESAGTLTVTQNTTYTLFQIDVPYASMSALCGDYRADLIEQTSGSDRVHWASGVITVRDEPLWSA